MAGTLTISTLSDGTNSTSSTNCIQGSAKAWVAFDGSTSPGTISGSYNVSSVSRTATGQYTVTFTNALASAAYCVTASTVGTSNFTGAGHAVGVFNMPTAGAIRTTTQVSLQVVNNSDAATVNANYISVAIFR